MEHCLGWPTCLCRRGAYAFFGFAVLSGLHPFLAMALTLPFGALLSIPVFAVVMRLRTAYFAIGSWVVAEVLSLSAGKLPGFGGGSGLSMPADIVRAFGADVTSRIYNVYWLAFAILALITFLIIKVLHSRHGLALKAIRDNETAAMALGVNPVIAKAVLFMISGAFLALLGAVNTLQKLRINPSAPFSVTDCRVLLCFLAPWALLPNSGPG
jgi:branched-chain amino acid transport system permease protein